MRSVNLFLRPYFCSEGRNTLRTRTGMCVCLLAFSLRALNQELLEQISLFFLCVYTHILLTYAYRCFGSLGSSYGSS